MSKFRVTSELRFTIEARDKKRAEAVAIRALGIALVEVSASEQLEEIIEVQGTDIICLTEEKDA